MLPLPALKKSNASEFASTSSFFLQSASASTKVEPLPHPWYDSAIRLVLKTALCNNTVVVLPEPDLIRGKGAEDFCEDLYPIGQSSDFSINCCSYFNNGY